MISQCQFETYDITGQDANPWNMVFSTFEIPYSFEPVLVVPSDSIVAIHVVVDVLVDSEQVVPHTIGVYDINIRLWYSVYHFSTVWNSFKLGVQLYCDSFFNL